MKSVITVGQLNAYVKLLLERDEKLKSVFVRGEISNFTNHYRTGHFYFTLKDENAVVRAVMFRSAAAKLKFLPENGMKVITRGRVSVFERDGQYQLYVDAMTPDGAGDLHIAFEQLKRKLSAEGLFDSAKKRPLPKLPLTVGVITSPTGAAVRDIIHVLGRRFPLAKVLLYPVLVQGDGAPPQIVEALEWFGASRACDVIILGRGGGSIEELWAFNSEAVARAIAACPVPVISAVGHETDFTIADFVADVRAPTPSAAAELAVPDTAELLRRFDNLRARLAILVGSAARSRREKLDALRQSRMLTTARAVTDERRMLLDYHLRGLLSEARVAIAGSRQCLTSVTARLNALSPLSVLARGYAFVTDEAGEPVRRAEGLREGDRLDVRFSDGVARCGVRSVDLFEKAEDM